LTLNYKSQRLEQIYKPDLICYDPIILELKAVKGTQSTGEQLPDGNKLEIRITDQLRQSPQSTN